MMYQSRPLFILPFLALSALAARAASADPFLSVPPASFLNYHVSSVRELSQEVTLDPIVCARLAHHFHRSAPSMAAYVQDNLVLTRLAHAGRYRVACVTPSGREYYVTERLAVGTPVFAHVKTGKPILKLACGNPLVASLPAAPPKPRPIAKAKPVVKAKPALLATSPQTAAPMPSAPVALPELVPAAPATAVLPAPDLAPLTRVGGSQQLLKGKGGFPFLPILAAGGVGVLPHGGGPRPQPVMTLTPGAPPAVIAPPPGAAVPEPSAVLLLALGGAGLAAGRLRKRPR